MDVGLIPKADGIESVIHRDGSTEDIMEVVVNASNKKVKKDFCKFAQQFDRSEEGLRKLWSFVKYKITYKVDPDGRQDILLPSALFERGYGDCKSKTVFIVHVLKCLNIPYIIRFTTYVKNGNMSHVYPIAYLDGKHIIVDSVYDFFNREKKYSEKTDVNMTKISMISGLRTPDIDADVKARLTDIKQKQEIVTPQEYVDMSGSIGETRSFLLKRQLQLLRAFASDNPKKVTEYNQAINLLDKAIVKGVKDYKVSGIYGGSDIVSTVGYLINTRLKDVRPTFDFKNTSTYKQAKIGNLNQAFPFDAKKINFGDFITEVNGQKKFRLGARTKYATDTNFLGNAIAKYVQRNAGILAQDRNGNYIKETITIRLPNQPVQTIDSYVQKIRLAFTRTQVLPVNASSGYIDPATNSIPFGYNNTQLFNSFYRSSGFDPNDTSARNFFQQELLPTRNTQSYVDNLMRLNQTKLFTSQFGAFSASNPNETWFSANFATEDIKTEFERFIEQESGIYQRYIQETVFNESGKVGAGVMYDYAMGAQGPRSLNDYPSAVVSKKVVQSAWMDGMSYFTGADSTIVRDLGRNTALFALGENPEDAMTKLYNSTRPAIGCEIACITAIIGAVVAVLTLVADTIVKCKQEADQLDPQQTKSPAIAPFGGSLMPNEGDWTPESGTAGAGVGPTSGAGAGAGAGTGTGTGGNNNLLIGLGLALAGGGYYLYSKNKKK